MSTPTPQTNGVAASVPPSQTSAPPSQLPTQTSQLTSQPTQPQATAAAAPQAPLSPATTAPRPRDARLIELLLMSQGVTSYESRVPLLLLDFAYRHTSSILNDAIHLSADPYTSATAGAGSGTGGSKGGASGAGGSANAAVHQNLATGGDATVSANAVRLAISARLAYQFRGGSGGAGISKEWLQDLARERNKVALPKVAPNEWGIRLPSERFVLSGVGWGLKSKWTEDSEEDEDDEVDMVEHSGMAMEGVETAAENVGGEGVEGGTMEDVFGPDELDDDVDME